jgi:hypothetical protein
MTDQSITSLRHRNSALRAFVTTRGVCVPVRLLIHPVQLDVVCNFGRPVTRFTKKIGQSSQMQPLGPAFGLFHEIILFDVRLPDHEYCRTDVELHVKLDAD